MCRHKGVPFVFTLNKLFPVWWNIVNRGLEAFSYGERSLESSDHFYSLCENELIIIILTFEWNDAFKKTNATTLVEIHEFRAPYVA